MKERLHKILAHCGVGSRRECETIIEQGRVAVDGVVITRLGTKVDPTEVVIKVDGERVNLEPRVYYLVNKPRGYLCTSRDDFGRPRVVDLIRDERRIYTVGRLDEESEGLLILTNDGNLANIICHPRYQVDKSYRLTINGPVQDSQLGRIERGVWLAEGKTAPAQIRRVDRKATRTFVTITIWEGRNRELRRMFAKVDLRVTHLLRTAIGPLRTEGLDVGAYRTLDPSELAFAYERMRPDWKPRPFRPAQAGKPRRPGGGPGMRSGGPGGPRGHGQGRGPGHGPSRSPGRGPSRGPGRGPGRGPSRGRGDSRR